tara:strand:+ start:2772 stop:6701 length:3930 start_codon:yes stop_codon:yes gene_type:complete
MTPIQKEIDERQKLLARKREQRREQLRQDQARRREAIKEAPGALAQGVGNFARFLKENPESGVKLGGLLTDAGGIAEAFGYYPDPFNEGKYMPSVAQQLREAETVGEYVGAGLTTLGAIPLVGIFARGIKGARAVSDIADAAEDAEEALKAGHKLDFPDLNGSSVRLEPDPFGKEDVLNINELQATELRKGYGTEMMNRIIADADRDGVTLTLMPERLGDDLLSMDDDELRAFYRKFGFRDRAPRTGDTPADSDSPLSKYMIREPKKAEEPKKASMSEAQYNAAIGAARGNPEEQQRLIAEKNEFYPKKSKKKKEPQKSARDLANEASIVEQDNTGVVRHIRSGERADQSTENFGFEGPGLTRYSTAATRALAKMKLPSRNVSGDDLLNRLELSAMTEDQSGIRSLIKEMGGLDDPNFIGKEGSGATITYDQFLERLNQYGPKRNVVRNADPEYPRMQELDYYSEITDPASQNFAINPVQALSFGRSAGHRFNNLHTFDRNIDPKTKTGQAAINLRTSHDHYKDLGPEIEEALGPGHDIIAHSRGGLYRMRDSANPSDNGHLTVGFDEFQIDGMSRLSKLRSEVTPQRRLKEKARIEKKASQFQDRAMSIGDDAIARFNSTEDDFTKNFNKIFEYYHTEGASEGQKIGDMVMMDKFLTSLRTADPARKFWEKNFHSMFRKPDFDPSNKDFLAKFVSSREGQNYMEDLFPGQLVDLRDKGNFGGFQRFSERMKRYGEAPENGAASRVLDGMSNIMKSGKPGDSFISRAFEGQKLDELNEAGEEYGNAVAELSVLAGDKLSRINIVDRSFVETADKYGDVIETLSDLKNEFSSLKAAEDKSVFRRLERLNQKTRDFSDFSNSMSSIDPSFAAKQQAQFRRIDNMVRLLKEAEDGERGIRSIKFDNGADFVKQLVDGFRKGRSAFDTNATGFDEGAEAIYSTRRVLEEDRDHVLAVLLEGDFTSLRGLDQYKNRRLDLSEGRLGRFDVTGSAEQLEKQRQLLEDLQFELRSLFGGDYENFSAVFKADSKLDNISTTGGGMSAVPEARTIAEQHQAMLDLTQRQNDLLKETADADPEFSAELVEQISSGTLRKEYDLPYESVSNSIEQVIQGDLANLFDGYLMNHTLLQSHRGRSVTAEDLLEPDTDFAVPKFIMIPTAGKTLQQRSPSVSFDEPGGFKFQDGARDAAIKNFMEDNPGLVKIRKELNEVASSQTDAAINNGYKSKDVVLEITEDTRRKYAEAFARAINNQVDQAEKGLLPRNADAVDSAEYLREEAMRYFKESNTDSETFVRYAKGGEVNLHKGIGAMAREVL